MTAALVVTFGWTLIVFLSLVGNFYQHQQEAKDIVLNIARTHLKKDIFFRKWVVLHGGVYAPVTELTQPNPYLELGSFPERDVVTPSGRVLTLINPAYMIRQLYGDSPDDDTMAPLVRISSLNPVRPENSPDLWEKEALKSFAKGGPPEKSEVQKMDGKQVIRLMQPIIAEPGCLVDCHPVGNYEEGDVMGGLSLTVPIAPFRDSNRHFSLGILSAHFVLWILVLFGVAFAFNGMHKRNLARQESEDALRRSEEYFRYLIENALDIITVFDMRGVAVFESPSTQRVLGKKPPVMLDKPLIEMLHPDDRGRVSEVLDRLAGQPGATVTFEMRCLHNDGTWRNLEAVGQMIPDQLLPPAFVINSRDITSRKRAEQKLLSYQGQLRSLASRLSQAEEETRRSIATGLHEQIGQNLSVIKLKLGALMLSAESPEAKEQLKYLDELLAATLKETRTLTFELSPPILYDIGLEASLKWVAEQFQSRNKIVCRVIDDGEEKPIDEDLRGVLFRSVQEALINIMKYAQAGEVSISIKRADSEIKIEIVDDGIGFNVDRLEGTNGQTSGFGIFSIRERLDLLGGCLEVVSNPGKGTKLTMTGPLMIDDEDDLFWRV